jgi:UDP-2,3-diacylglucosamine pyrophosphatase LpxH
VAIQKKYWDIYHTKLIRLILKWISKGVKVHYITGNHDEELRRLVGFKMSGLEISNKLVLDLNGKKTWFFHGDIFDVTMQYSKWLTRLGGYGYDILILINLVMNKILLLLKKEKYSFSKKVKGRIKLAVKFINQFEKTIVDIAVDNNYDSVVCGHIHEPCIKEFKSKGKNVKYLNSGDWVENLTSLEFKKNKWSLYNFEYSEFDFKEENRPINEFFYEMLQDYNLLK